MEPASAAPTDGSHPGHDTAMRCVLDAAGVAVATLDTEGRVLTATSAFAEAVAAGDGACGAHLVSLVPADDQAEVMSTLVRVMEGAPATAATQVDLMIGGRRRATRLTLSSSRTPAGVELAAALVDAGEERRRRRRVVELSTAAQRDDDTGLPAGDLVRSLVGTAVRRSARSGAPLAVMALRVDPTPGGALAAACADRLAGRLRAGDQVCRDGEAFVVLAEDLGDEQDAAGVAYRLLSSVVEPVTVDGAPTRISVTIGIAVGDGATPVDALVPAARAALDEAVADGRGGFRLVDLRGGRAA